MGATQLRDGPLSTVQAADWSVRWQQQMVDAAQALADAGQDFAGAARELGRLLRIEWPALGRQERSALGVVARALPAAAGRNLAFCMLPEGARTVESLQAGLQLLAQHGALCAQVPAPWPAELQERLAQALDLLGRRRGLEAELGTPWPAALGDELERGLQCIDEIAALRQGLSVKYGAGVGQLNVALLQREWAKAGRSLWPLSWLGRRKVRAALEAAIEGAGSRAWPRTWPPWCASGACAKNWSRSSPAPRPTACGPATAHAPTMRAAS